MYTEGSKAKYLLERYDKSRLSEVLMRSILLTCAYLNPGLSALTQNAPSQLGIQLSSIRKFYSPFSF